MIDGILPKIPLTTDTKEIRRFACTIAIAICAFSLVILPLVFRKPISIRLSLLAVPLVALAVVSPKLLNPVYRLWMGFAHVLGFINSRIILGVFYFLIFAPFMFVIGLFREDPMQRAKEPDASTYRTKRVKDNDKAGLERPF